MAHLELSPRILLTAPRPEFWPNWPRPKAQFQQLAFSQLAIRSGTSGSADRTDITEIWSPILAKAQASSSIATTTKTPAGQFPYRRDKKVAACERGAQRTHRLLLPGERAGFSAHEAAGTTDLESAVARCASSRVGCDAFTSMIFPEPKRRMAAASSLLLV